MAGLGVTWQPEAMGPRGRGELPRVPRGGHICISIDLHTSIHILYINIDIYIDIDIYIHSHIHIHIHYIYIYITYAYAYT